MTEETYRGKTMAEWKAYSEKEGIGDIGKRKYIIVLEERVAELETQCALADVVGQSKQLECYYCGRTEQQHTDGGTGICPNIGGRFKAS